MVTPVAATPNIMARATLSSQFLGKGDLVVVTPASMSESELPMCEFL